VWISHVYGTRSDNVIAVWRESWSVVIGNDRIPMFNWKSPIPSSHSPRIENVLREECKFGTKVISLMILCDFLGYLVSIVL
jgi:outer membrane phospholipase A